MREYLTLAQLRSYSFAKIQRLQNLRFKATCSYLLPQVPFYKHLFQAYNIDQYKLHTPEDWKKLGLPLIKKATYLERPKEFVVTPDVKNIFQNHLRYLIRQDEYQTAAALLLAFDKKERLKNYYSPKMLVFSGGTESGNPVPVLLTAQQKFDTLMSVLRMIGQMALGTMQPEKTTGMNLFPYAPHLGWHAVHHALDINADLNLCTAAGGAISTERLVQIADKTKPNIICGMSEYLRNRFLPLAIQKKITLPEQVLFVNGAQKMHEPEREKISQLAGKIGVKDAIVLDLYGASELKEALLPECQPGSGFHHVAPLSTIIRTVEAEHATKEFIDEWNFVEGKGYAASWNIDGGGTLLAGYLLGDHYEKVVNERCAHCSLNVVRIYNINRIREVEAQLKLTGVVEEKIKGTRVNLAAYRETALAIPEVKEAQVVLQRKKAQLELKYVSDKPAIARQKLTKAFAAAEMKPKLIFTTLDKIQGKKIKLEAIRIE